MRNRLRFNDLMQTVLDAKERSGFGAVTLWRQCVDLLAQHDRSDRVSLPLDQREALLSRLHELKSEVSETQRIATVVELGSRLRSPTLVRFFGNDRSAVAATAVSRARLTDTAWIALLPELNPTARGVLRGRSDVGADTHKALEAFGSTDLVLTTDVPVEIAPPADMLLTPEMVLADTEGEENRVSVQPEAEPVSSLIPKSDQIRELVSRINRFTSERSSSKAIPVSDAKSSTEVRSFAFETDVGGMILWVDNGPRAALIGLSLGETALDGSSGPDGNVAGAFSRRSAFQNGRFTIVGGAMAGDWRVTASPFFDPQSGRFQGYRGQARRPYIHEVAAVTENDNIAVAGLSADSLRQLVHELRTPLNAILGFAEIIEQQLFGATNSQYQEMAGKIVKDARHLLNAFEDLDLAARISRGEDVGEVQSVDPALLMAQAISRFNEFGAIDDQQIDIKLSPNLPMVSVDPVRAERMVQHLFRTVISVAEYGDRVSGACWFAPEGAIGGKICLAIERPVALKDYSEFQLLDPSHSPEGEWADGPLLGLGFSLRLIRNLADACGGRFDIEADRFILVMPAVTELGDMVGGH